MAVDEDLAKIAEQEAELVFDSFDPHVAFALGTLTRDLAIERELGIVVDVTLFSMPLFYAALPDRCPTIPTGCAASATRCSGSCGRATRRA